MSLQEELENSAERRKFMRFDIPLVLKFKLMDAVSGSSSGTTINFSRHGFCFESAGPALPSSETVEFELQIPGKDTFVPIRGYVVWSSTVDTKFMAGVQIREMNREAKSDILEYCYDTWLETVRKRKMSSGIVDNRYC
jgi:c-di-GMP-binding flagellar brake protein YcgR